MTTTLYSVISRTLKTSRQRKDNFHFVLEALLSHLKPSILFDFCSTTPSQLQQILQDSGHDDVIKVVKLLDDVILVDISHDFLINYSPEIIDCSRHLNMPQLADSTVIGNYTHVFQEMMEAVRLGISPVDLDTLCQQDICLTTIFGMFLQYPYAYYTSDAGNCLAGVELVVVELGHQTKMSSSSDKKTMVLPSGDKKTMVLPSGDKRDCRTFTSFSVPKLFCPDESVLRDIACYVSHRTVILDSVAM